MAVVSGEEPIPSGVDLGRKKIVDSVLWNVKIESRVQERMV